MSVEVTKNQKRFTEEVPSERNLKTKSDRGERHCEKNEFSKRRSKECNKNCNHFQHVERGNDDDMESGYFEFQSNQERHEILNQILKNKISSETKKSTANKLNEVPKKMKLQESDETLSSRESYKKKKKEKSLRAQQKEMNKAFNTNVNSFSKRNLMSKNKVFRSELEFNNNNPEEEEEKLAKRAIRMKRAREKVRKLSDDKKILQLKAIRKEMTLPELPDSEYKPQPRVRNRSKNIFKQKRIPRRRTTQLFKPQLERVGSRSLSLSMPKTREHRQPKVRSKPQPERTPRRRTTSLSRPQPERGGSRRLT